MKKNITLLRHAHTLHNGPPKIFQGRLDVGISEKGKKQCLEASDSLNWVTSIVASPAKRVRETLAFTFGDRLKEMEIQYNEKLWEIDNGWFSGMSESDVQEKDPELYERWCKEPHKCRPGGGETLLEMQQRALSAIDNINLSNPELNNILVATHGGVIRVLKLHYEGLALSEFHSLEVKNLCTYKIP